MRTTTWRRIEKRGRFVVYRAECRRPFYGVAGSTLRYHSLDNLRRDIDGGRLDRLLYSPQERAQEYYQDGEPEPVARWQTLPLFAMENK